MPGVDDGTVVAGGVAWRLAAITLRQGFAM